MLLAAKPGVEMSMVGSRAVLFDPASGDAMVLNPTGSILWPALQAGSATLETLADVLHAAFPEIPRDVCRDDTVRFVEDLEKSGVVVSTEASRS